jgi:hypothetical protein
MIRSIAVGTAVVLATKPSMGSPVSPDKAHIHLDMAVRGSVARRQCVAATPDVNQTIVGGLGNLQCTSTAYKSQIISDSCNQNPQKRNSTCVSELSASPSGTLNVTTKPKC